MQMCESYRPIKCQHCKHVFFLSHASHRMCPQFSMQFKSCFQDNFQTLGTVWKCSAKCLNCSLVKLVSRKKPESFAGIQETTCIRGQNYPMTLQRLIHMWPHLTMNCSCIEKLEPETINLLNPL